MENQNKKSEFIIAMGAITDQVNELVKKFPDCGAVVLANDSSTEEIGENTILSVLGKGKSIIESIAEFTINPQFQHIMSDGLKVGMIKRMCQYHDRIAADQAEAKAEQESNENN